MNFLDRFWEIVHRQPDKTAITDAEGARSITYRELYVQSGRVAAKLLQESSITGRAVLVCLGRSMEYVAAEIGIMMAGSAFVPLLLDCSKEQLSYIEKDCHAACRIDAAWMEDIGQYEPVVKSEEDDTDRAMIIYTPGPGGRPRGVVHSHASLYDGAVRSVQALGLGEWECLAAAAPMSDACAVAEYFAVFCSGGCVHILSEETADNVRLLEDYYAGKGITCGFISPQILSRFRNRGTALKKVFTWGRQACRGLCADGYEIYHVYGCAETAAAAFFHMEAPVEYTPAGKPVPGVEMFLLDDEGNGVPDGLEGEICIQGILGECYLNMEEESARTFRMQEDGSILVHTGDIGRKLADGNVILADRRESTKG